MEPGPIAVGPYHKEDSIMRRFTAILITLMLSVFVLGVVSIDAQVAIPEGVRTGGVGYVVGTGPDTVTLAALTVTNKGNYAESLPVAGVAVWAKAPYRVRRLTGDITDTISFPVDSVSWDNSGKGSLTYLTPGLV